MNGLIKFFGSAGGALSTLALTATVAFAQAPGEIKIIPGNSPRVEPGPLISSAIQLVFFIAFLVVFVILIIGGIRWMLAGGDEKAVTAAKGMVTGALIGLVVVLAAWTILQFAGIFFGIKVLEQFTIPTPGGPQK